MFAMLGLLGVVMAGAAFVGLEMTPEEDDETSVGDDADQAEQDQAAARAKGAEVPIEITPLTEPVMQDDRIISGGDEADTITGGDAHDQIGGGDGADDLRGGAGGDDLHGEAGNDRIDGEDGADTLHGEDGDDALHGGAGDDVLSGYLGADTLFGGDGDDCLLGGAGDDLLRGGAGHDSLMGGWGDDTLAGEGGGDAMFGGEGNDVIDGRNDDAAAGAPDYLNGGAGDDTITTGNDDIVTGGAGADTMILGDWIDDPAQVQDYDPQEDRLVVIFDDSDTGATLPNLSLSQNPDAPEAIRLLLDGVPIASFAGAGAPTLDHIALVGRSTLA